MINMELIWVEYGMNMAWILYEYYMNMRQYIIWIWNDEIIK
jgi:hypothetical protein